MIQRMIWIFTPPETSSEIRRTSIGLISWCLQSIKNVFIDLKLGRIWIIASLSVKVIKSVEFDHFLSDSDQFQILIFWTLRNEKVRIWRCLHMGHEKICNKISPIFKPSSSSDHVSKDAQNSAQLGGSLISWNDRLLGRRHVGKV